MIQQVRASFSSVTVDVGGAVVLQPTRGPSHWAISSSTLSFSSAVCSRPKCFDVSLFDPQAAEIAGKPPVVAALSSKVLGKNGLSVPDLRSVRPFWMEGRYLLVGVGVLPRLLYLLSSSSLPFLLSPTQTTFSTTVLLSSLSTTVYAKSPTNSHTAEEYQTRSVYSLRLDRTTFLPLQPHQQDEEDLLVFPTGLCFLLFPS